MLVGPGTYLQLVVLICLGQQRLKGLFHSATVSGTTLTLQLHHVFDVTNQDEPVPLDNMSVEWNDAYKISIAS